MMNDSGILIKEIGGGLSILNRGVVRAPESWKIVADKALNFGSKKRWNFWKTLFFA